jgi:hypothetical protein
VDARIAAAIAHARRTVFLIPFSHWDTDWHHTFAYYAPHADGNIRDAILLARQDSTFRYTFEQVLFVQHFWDRYPAYRAELRRLVRSGRFTFAWPGITQPETSLVPAAVQVRNLELGRRWIAATFGVSVHTAWQSDAFGNSAALPVFLAHSGISDLFIGRWQGGCDPDYAGCTPLPAAFYWVSPVDPRSQVLVAYTEYSSAQAILRHNHGVDAQVGALRALVARGFARTSSPYLFLPIGDDFTSPSRALLDLVRRWNAVDRTTALVISDPATAFRYLASTPLPHLKIDLNPIWQGFYGSRPAAKIAGQESAFLLTAADKFSLLSGSSPPDAAWQLAAINAHYDNASAVGYDHVWDVSQGPRFAQAVASAGTALRAILAGIAQSTRQPLLLFNSAAWPRDRVVELHGAMPDRSALPPRLQQLPNGGVAFLSGDVPALGYAPPARDKQAAAPAPVTVTRRGNTVTMSNGLSSVSLDAARGGTMTHLAAPNGPELLRAPGDDVTYLSDDGDIYGSFFGGVLARESEHPARIEVQAGGPLLGRLQVTMLLGGQPLTKTVTLRAGSPLVEVTLNLAPLTQSSAVLQVPTTRAAYTRTDDTGFGAFAHLIDDSPITPGTVTYRREVFYPIQTWSDVSSGGAGLSLITHGLQGLGGTNTLNLLLLREVSDASDSAHEGISDPGTHTLRYAYLPHRGDATTAQAWLWATDFNQPLLPVWQSGGRLLVQLPFLDDAGRSVAVAARVAANGATASILAASNAEVADLYRDGGTVTAVLLRPDPRTPATLQTGAGEIAVPDASLSLWSLGSTTHFRPLIAG